MLNITYQLQLINSKLLLKLVNIITTISYIKLMLYYIYIYLYIYLINIYKSFISIVLNICIFDI